MYIVIFNLHGKQYHSRRPDTTDLPQQAPQPQDPDASLQTTTPGDRRDSLSIIETPFHELTKLCHHSKSARNAAFSLIINLSSFPVDHPAFCHLP